MAAPKSTLTRARRAVIVEAVKNGNTIANACRLARVTPEQGRAWIKKSRDLDSELELGGKKVVGVSLYYGFAEDVDAAMAQVEADLVAAIIRTARSGAANTWQSAMTYLERTRPSEYSRRDTTVIEGGQRPVQLDMTDRVIHDPEVRALSRELLRKIAGDTRREELSPAALPGIEDVVQG